MAKLDYLNPMMDYGNNGLKHIFKTSCVGFEIKDGMVQDVRKIRFFNVDESKAGFITDDFEEAHSLTRLLNYGHNEHLLKRYPRIAQYKQEKEGNPPEIIAISVRAFIKGNLSPSRRHLLDFLDLDSLREAGINIFDYSENMPLLRTPQFVSDNWKAVYSVMEET